MSMSKLWEMVKVREAWRAAVHGVAMSWTQLSDWTTTPWTVAHQAPLSVGFSRQEYWSGLPCPPAGDLPHPGIESALLTSPALAGRFFTSSTTWEAQSWLHHLLTVQPWARSYLLGLSFPPLWMEITIVSAKQGFVVVVVVCLFFED